MMIYSLCNTCLQAYRVLVEVSDIEVMKQVTDEGGMSKCPRLCGGFINLIGDPTIEQMHKDPRLRPPMHITGKQLYQAINGLGLPDEIPQSAETVAAFLKSEKIKSVSVEDVRGNIYIDEIRLENGVTIHLGSGPYGAVVIKTTKERTPNGPSNPG